MFVNKENRMDPVKILKRAWYILWSYRALWIFGLILAIAAGSSSGNGSNNSRREQISGQNPQLTPQSMQQAFREFQNEVHKFFEQGIPQMHITGQEISTFFWVVG